jgi:Ni,Fe-hydrogenase III large subunit
MVVEVSMYEAEGRWLDAGSQFTITGMETRADRTSTYANGPGIVPLIRGSHLADVGLITITFDPCIGCFDR